MDKRGLRIFLGNLVTYGILFYLLTISLSSNLFRLIGTHFAERLLYAPSLGFCFAISALLSHYIDRKADLKQKFLTLPSFFRSRPVLMLIIGALSLSLFLKTFIQSGVWKNNISLFEHGVKAAPHSMRTHYYFGNYLIDGEYYKSLPANYFIGKILQNSALPEEQRQTQYFLNKATSLDPQYK